MKNRLRIIICLVLALFTVRGFAQNDYSTQLIAEFDMVSYDFGEILQGQEAVAVFTLTNKGGVPLVVEDVKASCGCTLVEWTKDPLLPEQSSKIIVKYNSNILGNIKRSIVVNTNVAEQERILLMITGNVISSIDY